MINIVDDQLSSSSGGFGEGAVSEHIPFICILKHPWNWNPFPQWQVNSWSLVPPSVSSQEPSCGLSTHCSSSNYQLRPRHVFHFPYPSHGGRSLAEGRGTLPRPRGLGLYRTRSQKNLCTVSERCESFHQHVKVWTLAGMLKKLDGLWGKKQFIILLLDIDSNKNHWIFCEEYD